MSAAVMVDAALALSARYGWALFPARFKKNKAGKWQKLSWKSGPTSNGQRWGATSDPDQIRLDFADPQRCAVGIPTGPGNGIFVLEADTAEGHDVDGKASLKALERQYDDLPRTLIAWSSTGSAHYYFKWPTLPDGVTIRISACSRRGYTRRQGHGHRAAVDAARISRSVLLDQRCANRRSAAVADRPDYRQGEREVTG
jgi:hypothetical protein